MQNINFLQLQQAERNIITRSFEFRGLLCRKFDTEPNAKLWLTSCMTAEYVQKAGLTYQLMDEVSVMVRLAMLMRGSYQRRPCDRDYGRVLYMDLCIRLSYHGWKACTSAYILRLLDNNHTVECKGGIHFTLGSCEILRRG